MRRALAIVSVCIIVIGGSRPLEAASNPIINVSTFGVELCPQSLCGAAIFTGLLYGQVGNVSPALGTFIVAVTHAPLPDPFEAAAVTGGEFELRVGLRRIRGVVSGGTLFNNGNNTFTVQAVLTIVSGGSGVVYYTGLLNHNVFPPTIIGTISQTP
jgi:hypothetical protein